MKRPVFIFYVLLVCFAILSLTGCMTSPSKRYFQLRIPGARLESITPVGKVLMIKKVEVEKVYDQFRMVYRTSPYELNYYSYNFWIKKPGDLMRDAITEFFSMNEVFSSIIQEYSQGEPDWELLVWLTRMEDEDFGRLRYGRLAMKFEIRDYKTGLLVVSHEFDRRKLLKERKIHSVPVELSMLLEEELMELIKKIQMNTPANPVR